MHVRVEKNDYSIHAHVNKLVDDQLTEQKGK